MFEKPPKLEGKWKLPQEGQIYQEATEPTEIKPNPSETEAGLLLFELFKLPATDLGATVQPRPLKAKTKTHQGQPLEKTQKHHQNAEKTDSSQIFSAHLHGNHLEDQLGYQTLLRNAQGCLRTARGEEADERAVLILMSFFGFGGLGKLKRSYQRPKRISKLCS